MSMEQIDDLAARGAMSGLTFWKRKDGWQVNFQSAATGGWACLTRDTPSEGLAAVLELNPTCEAYDRQHGLDKPTPDAEEMLAPPDAEEMLAPPAVDEPPLPDDAHDEAGIFD